MHLLLARAQIVRIGADGKPCARADSPRLGGSGRGLPRAVHHAVLSAPDCKGVPAARVFVPSCWHSAAGYERHREWRCRKARIRRLKSSRFLIDRRVSAVFEQQARSPARPDGNRLEHGGPAHTQEPAGLGGFESGWACLSTRGLLREPSEGAARTHRPREPSNQREPAMNRRPGPAEPPDRPARDRKR